MKIGLGTVQFGLDYGISNPGGKSSLSEVEEILKLAETEGVRVLDTAALYGESETVLGETLPDSHSFSIVTKTIKLSSQEIENSALSQIENAFYQSLEKLRQRSVYGLLIHSAKDLMKPEGYLLIDLLQKLKSQGLIEKIGVSVYEGKEIDYILERFSIDLVQLPINILDQRLIQKGQLQKLKDAKVEVHARSIFLQGLLFMNPDDLTSHFKSVKDHLKQFHKTIAKQGISPLQAAIEFVIDRSEIDFAICGVNNSSQLKELLSCSRKITSKSGICYSNFAIQDESILNPSFWPR